MLFLRPELPFGMKNVESQGQISPGVGRLDNIVNMEA